MGTFFVDYLNIFRTENIKIDFIGVKGYNTLNSYLPLRMGLSIQCFIKVSHDNFRPILLILLV